MARRDDVRDFLVGRRARVTPEQAGLPSYGRRRVPGLRREEVALLAGVSVDYYNRLERGNLSGVSDQVLDGVARALQLDEAERAHLLDMARSADPAARTRRTATTAHVPSTVQRVLDGMTEVPAVVCNARLDVVSASRLGYALFAPVFDPGSRPPNLVRFAFLDPRAHELYPNWGNAADVVVALLRAEITRDPDNREVSDLVDELSSRSGEFRTRWSSHIVALHWSGVKLFCHPVVGSMSLNYETMHFPSENGLTLYAYSAERGSTSDDALKVLASWAASGDQAAKS